MVYEVIQQIRECSDAYPFSVMSTIGVLSVAALGLIYFKIAPAMKKVQEGCREVMHGLETLGPADRIRLNRALSELEK